jgi:AraC-like DNA-binding protein
MKAIPIRRIRAGGGERGLFTIRDLRQVLNGGDLVHELHKHDFFFVLAIKKGKGTHEIDFVQHKVHDHSIFILRPGQVHRLELQAGTTGFVMEFDLMFYQPSKSITDLRWKKASSKNYCEVETARFDRLYAYLANIFHEFNNRQDGYREAIRATLDLFFIEYNRQSVSPASIAKTGTGYAQDRYEELVQLLEAKIGTVKNVGHYAELMNLSPYQLNAITRTAVGKTVSDLIKDRVILEAKRYLLATPHQVKEVADHLGYEDVSYFIRFFKKQTGQSPEAFRKSFK